MAGSSYGVRHAGITIARALDFFLFFFFFSFTYSPALAIPDSCARSCAALNCDSAKIRYGKYCGLGWTGCPGEAPCDALDACCMTHDLCVTAKGMIQVKCHEQFKRCVGRVKRTGKPGFSLECPYERIMPTLLGSMDVAIMVNRAFCELRGDLCAELSS